MRYPFVQNFVYLYVLYNSTIWDFLRRIYYFKPRVTNVVYRYNNQFKYDNVYRYLYSFFNILFTMSNLTTNYIRHIRDKFNLPCNDVEVSISDKDMKYKIISNNSNIQNGIIYAYQVYADHKQMNQQIHMNHVVSVLINEKNLWGLLFQFRKIYSLTHTIHNILSMYGIQINDNDNVVIQYLNEDANLDTRIIKYEEFKTYNIINM